MCELTEDDYHICIAAISKCQILKNYVKAGLPVTLTDKNFGFIELTDKEESELLNKLHDASKMAWLKQSRK